MDKFCRLCLSMTSEHFNEINNSKYQKQLETIIPELNIKSIQAPLLCQKCSIVLEAAYELKTRSLRIDKYFSVFVDIMQTDVVPVSEIFNIKIELDRDLGTETTDNISFTDIQKIEENTVYCDDKYVDMPTSIPSSVNDEPKNDLAMTLDKENHLVDLNNQSSQEYLASEEDFIIVDDLKEDIEGHENTTKKKTLEIEYCKEIGSDEKFVSRPSCTICRKKCKSQTSLKNHLFRHKDADTEYACIVCGIKIKGRIALSFHYNKKHWGKNAHPCKICTRRFIEISDLQEHMLTHLGTQEVLCESP